ncbi:hypothetical protein LTR64_003879 [Lithohypha guttulata]|uniref:uncharacterized protein n=1 Tax=Lithohypha guttulata TaxID=1690604 RepID=UPI002DDEEF38|nr:hypothetical protein LTR51_006917 [Lithohypha guttulata]
MNDPAFNQREKGFEDDYIRRREAEKFAQKRGAAAQPQQPGSNQSGTSQGAATTGKAAGTSDATGK